MELVTSHAMPLQRKTCTIGNGLNASLHIDFVGLLMGEMLLIIIDAYPEGTEVNIMSTME